MEEVLYLWDQVILNCHLATKWNLKTTLPTSVTTSYCSYARFSIVVTVLLYTVMQEVGHWVTNEKQRKTDIRLTDQQLDVSKS